MKRFLSFACLISLLSAASGAAAQSTSRTAVDAEGWPIEPAAVVEAAPATGWNAPATGEKPSYNTGWMSAPGMSLSLHDRPSTDYWGRPLKAKAARQRKAAPPREDLALANEPADDPMMRSSGVMIAPGMNTAPYRGVSTDYWGRPLRKPARGASTLSGKAAKPTPSVAAANTSQW